MASEEEMKAELERLRAENEALKKPARSPMFLKVSEKGALSVYGLGRFPVTLYREQWEKLLGMADPPPLEGGPVLRISSGDDKPGM